MSNQPLDSNDKFKIIVFTFLFLPAVGFGAGIIPALFLGFGIYMMKESESFSPIETAVKYFKVYMWIAAAILGGCLIYIYRGHLDDPMFLWIIFWMGAPIMYIVFVTKLFLNPLNTHKEWVVSNGIFSSKPKQNIVSEMDVLNPEKLDVIKRDKLTAYSVADELSKWAKLKEDGHITNEDFEKAKKELLKN